MIKNVCVFTGTRAEYGLLKPLMQLLRDDRDLNLQIVVSGMHLSSQFGSTWEIIEQDGFKINEKVEMLLDSDSTCGTVKSMALGMIDYCSVIERLDPDVIIILGDRFETFAFGSVAMLMSIPIAHIHGGELTFGALDDTMRHCLTKMSRLHFVTTQQYRKRVIQIGQHPDSVFYVGALGVDNISNLQLLSETQLQKELNIEFGKKNILVTYHPETAGGNSFEGIKALLAVVQDYEDAKVFFTGSNSDPGSRAIRQAINQAVSLNSDRMYYFESLGTLRYLSMLQYVDAVVGNSSSGIIEAPSFKIGTINIGDRQKGRICAESVINCDPDKNSIKLAFKKLYSSEFQEKRKTVKNPYGDGCSAPRIVEIIKKTDLSGIIKKEFYNIDFEIEPCLAG